MRLPRPCRLSVCRGSADAGQFAIGESLAAHVAHRRFKPGLIVHALAVVVPERLFVKIAEQVERFHAHIGTADTALQQAPEVFKAIGMNTTIHILDSMIHNLVGVVGSQSFVGEQRIRVESRTRFDMLSDLRLQGGFLAVRNNDVRT